MHLTERAVWGAAGAGEIIAWLKNGAGSYCGWVTMLDSHGRTHQWVGAPGPTMFIQNAEKPEDYRTLPEAYILGQFARYIRPGYVLADSSECQKDFCHVACKDPKTGTMVLVTANASDKPRRIRVICGEEEFTAAVLAQTVATFTW